MVHTGKEVKLSTFSRKMDNKKPNGIFVRKKYKKWQGIIWKRKNDSETVSDHCFQTFPRRNQ